jgi:hypothetical protein
VSSQYSSSNIFYKRVYEVPIGPYVYDNIIGGGGFGIVVDREFDENYVYKIARASILEENIVGECQLYILTENCGERLVHVPRNDIIYPNDESKLEHIITQAQYRNITEHPIIRLQRYDISFYHILTDTDITVTDDDLIRIVVDTIVGYIILKSNGITHVDMYPRNVLCKLDENKQYRGTLSDYGLVLPDEYYFDNTLVGVDGNKVGVDMLVFPDNLPDIKMPSVDTFYGDLNIRKFLMTVKKRGEEEVLDIKQEDVIDMAYQQAIEYSQCFQYSAFRYQRSRLQRYIVDNGIRSRDLRNPSILYRMVLNVL